MRQHSCSRPPYFLPARAAEQGRHCQAAACEAGAWRRQQRVDPDAQCRSSARQLSKEWAASLDSAGLGPTRGVKGRLGRWLQEQEQGRAPGGGGAQVAASGAENTDKQTYYCPPPLAMEDATDGFAPVAAKRACQRL